MIFKKFVIYAKDDARQVEEQVDMIINLNHVISVKPIRMSTNDRRVMKGYWVRLTNGKKYKAVSIPDELKLALDEKMSPISYEGDTMELNIQ